MLGILGSMMGLPANPFQTALASMVAGVPPSAAGVNPFAAVAPPVAEGAGKEVAAYANPMVENAPGTMTDASSQPQQQPQQPSASGSPDTDWSSFIRQTAQKYGVDPDVALRVAQSEGGLSGWVQSKVTKNGRREPSFGPFQMLVGGPGTGFPEGMGNQFMRETGLDPRDPRNGKAAIDFALREASRKGWGQWYGAAKAGIGNFHGIGGKADPSIVADTTYDPGTGAGAQPAAQRTASQRVLDYLGSGNGLAGGVLAALAGSPSGSTANSQPPTPGQRVVAAVTKTAAHGGGRNRIPKVPDAPEADMSAVDTGAEEVASVQQGLNERAKAGDGKSALRRQERKQALTRVVRRQA